MERFSKYLKENGWLITAVLVLGIFFAGNASATGGFGCPGVKHPTYRCNCDNGQYETYTSDDDLNRARENPKSCCYSKPVNVSAIQQEPYHLAPFGGWLLVDGVWRQTLTQDEVLARWTAWVAERNSKK